MQLVFPGYNFVLVARLALLILNSLAAVFIIAASLLQQNFEDGDELGLDLMQFAPVSRGVASICCNVDY